MVVHLLKVSVRGKAAVFIHSFCYFSRFLQWRLSLAIIHPLNFLREKAALVIIRKGICKFLLSKHFVNAALPVNLQPLHAKRFLNNFYIQKPLEIIHLKNYWLYLTAYHGIAFKNFRILPESIHGKWDKRNVSLLKDYFPMVMNAWMYARHEKEGAITELTGGKEYLLVHNWFNYYHWLTETVLRMWLVKESAHDYILLLPESFREILFVQQSLMALDVRNIQYVKEGVIRVPNLTLVENKAYCNHYFPELTRAIGNYFSDYVKKTGINSPDFGGKIFISRKKAERRRLVNEAAVEQMLAAYGFKAIAFEDFDLFQQIAILRKAKYLIGMHGAGLTNMLFMPEGGKVLELHREIYTRHDLFSDVYWKLASALGHDYYYQFCEAESKDAGFFTANYLADLKKLKENIENFIR